MYLKRILTYSILSLVALGGFFGNVEIHTEEYDPTILVLNGGSIVQAAEDPYANETVRLQQFKAPTNTNTTPVAKTTVDKYNDMIDAINIALAVLSAIVSPIILFVGWLMSPDWTSGDLFGLRTPMYSLWVTVSNIVYFVYAILLILIALGTMFGQDKFSYKVMLPKLALGILMVPFTWWFVQWTISLSSVLTASVMTIPLETISKGDSAWFLKESIPREITVDNRGSSGTTSKPDCSKANQCISAKDFLAKSGGMYGPLVVYGYSIFKFEEITTLTSGLDMASAALKIVHTSIVSAIMFAVFGLLTLALATILLVRAIKLWVYAIFAPLFTFRFVAGSNLMGGDDDTFSIKEFIGLAFVPAVVGLTLSFGLIMINAVQSSNGSASNIVERQPCDLTVAPGCELKNIMGSPSNKIARAILNENDGKGPYTSTIFQYADIKFIFLGKATNQTDTKSNVQGTLDSLGGIFGTLIVDIIALVFIWVAFMAAKNVSKAVKAAVEPFEKIGTQVGTLAKSLPKYTPLPLPGGSVSGMGKVADGISRIPQVRSDKRFEDSGVGQWIKGETNGASVAETQKLRDAIMSHPENLKDSVKMSMEGFRNEGIKEILKNEDKFKTAVQDNRAKYNNDTDRAKILELFEKAKKDHGLNQEDAAKLQAILSGQKHDISFEKAKEVIKGFKDGTTSATNASTTSAINVTVNGGDKFTFSGTGFELKDKTKNEIMGELKKRPEALKGANDDQIKESLKKIGAIDAEIEELIKKVEIERKK